MPDIGKGPAREAGAFAPDPQIAILARDAVRQTLAIPLAVTGYREAAVTVTFDGEPTT